MEAFAAVADPARRDILSALARGDLSAGQVAALFPVSRPAVSRHLRVLREAGLVRDELVGRRRVYRLDPTGLTPVTVWLASVVGGSEEGAAGAVDAAGAAASHPASPSGVWSGRIDALETEVRRTRRQRRTAPPSTQKETA